MKKLLKKMKKVFIALGASIVGFTSKVFGASDIFNEADKWITSNYDTEITTSEPPLSPFENPIFIFMVVSTIIIFITGIIVLINKKLTKKSKTIISVVLIVIFLLMVIIPIIVIPIINTITY